MLNFVQFEEPQIKPSNYQLISINTKQKVQDFQQVTISYNTIYMKQ